MDRLQREKLLAFCRALIDQEKAQIVVAPKERRSGFWFGGGNMVEGKDGSLYLSGRYRNFGDSRTGLGAGERGLALVVFQSTDQGKTFSQVLSLSKQALTVGDREVLSIEGSALHLTEQGVALFVSTEKSGIGYPEGLEGYLKPNTGVWTIERLEAETVEGLRQAEAHTVIECRDAQFLHVKDPFLLARADGALQLGFVTHPFSWSSSNTGYAVQAKGSEHFAPPVYEFFPRGYTWDVAISRGTAWMRVPRMGAFADSPPMTLLFYDGGESMRNYDEHAKATKRPRGYSCEELGGVALSMGDGLANFERLSVNFPLFVSPMGAGTSRYVDVLETDEGFYATWQQSQRDFSQPLVMNFVSRADAERILR